MLKSFPKENWIYFLVFAVVALTYVIWKRKIKGIKKDKDIPIIFFLAVFIVVALSIIIHFYA